jgi:hypothetical protein
MKIKILLFLSILGLWIIPIDLYANTSTTLDSVTITYTSSSPINLFHRFDKSDNLKWKLQVSPINTSNFKDNYIEPTAPWDYDVTININSFNIGLKYAIVLVQGIEYNVTLNNLFFEWYATGDLEISWRSWDNLNYYLISITYDPQDIPGDLYVSILNQNLAVEQDVTNAFNSGYSNGAIDGYNEAIEDYAIIYNGSYITASQWGTLQYQEGLSQGPENTLAIRNMIPGILGVTFAFFFQLASISFLGISALDLIGAMITIATSIFIIRIFLNR